MNFFKRLFSKSGTSRKVKRGIPIKVDMSSQSYRLMERMYQAGMTHDQTVLADLQDIKVRNEGGQPVMYFCDMNKIKIKEHISKGNGGYLPKEVVLHGINLPKKFAKIDHGFYRLKNVKLHSNGTLQLIATAETEIELEHAE